MTEIFNKYEIREIDHTKFGGYIYLSDFNTNCREKNNTHGSTIASRIASDNQFDKQCKKNAINLERDKQYDKY